jgi:hypothetical protein
MFWPEHKFMVNYEKFSEAELDQYLALSYLPTRREKVNLSDKDNFLSLIIPKLRYYDLVDEFGLNIIFFLRDDKKISTRCNNENELVVETFCMNMRQIKMAALKTYHDNTDTVAEKLRIMAKKLRDKREGHNDDGHYN